MKTILVVDDDRDIHELLKKRLGEIGYLAEFAENGKIGVEKAFSLRPGMILMYLHLPVLDGEAAVKELRQRGYAGLIAAFTSSIMDEDQQLLLKVGCDDYVEKPLEADFKIKIQNI